MVDKNIDILALTETWLKSNECPDFITLDICPLGYAFVHIPRPNGTGGGIGLLYRKDLKIQQVKTDTCNSFEFMEVLFHSSSSVIRIVIVYRPPLSSKNGLTHAQFFDEFSYLLELLVSSSGKLLLAGDFNFHVNDRSNGPACQFLDLLNCFNLNTMNVNIPTHKSDNVLDLIITRLDETTTSNFSIDDPAISDHFAVHCNLAVSRPPNPKQVLKSRKLCNVNLHKLRQDINSSTLVKSPSSDITELCDQYDAVLSSILDEHAPLRTRIITLRPHAPWYNNEIRKQKTICRKRERCWRRSGLASDYQSYVDQCLVVKNTIFKSKMDYYSNLIDEAGNDNKSLFRTIDRLLHRKPEKCLPSCSSATELANNFITFFENKIINIRCKLEAAEMPDLFCTLDKLTLDCQLNAFSPTSIVELSEVARTVVSKSCSLDPLPAVLLKENFDMLLPTLCRIVNLSLESGYVPPSLKNPHLTATTQETILGPRNP